MKPAKYNIREVVNVLGIPAVIAEVIYDKLCSEHRYVVTSEKEKWIQNHVIIESAINKSL